MNLPNILTGSRIALAPLIAWLPFAESSTLRFIGFVLFIAAALTDYFDGKVARARNLVTDFGRIVDPLADKLLLLATIIPMYILMAPANDWFSPPPGVFEASGAFPFDLPFGYVGLPAWVLIIVLGREIFMMTFRQVAAARGLIIEAIGPAKWKTGCQWTWVGAAYLWFAAVTAAARNGWTTTPQWHAWALFNGTVGVVAMSGAVTLSLYSLTLYLTRYGSFVFLPAGKGGPRP